nr:MAG: hypothetical protein [Helarchaeota virus Nidhogg Meg22_1012]URC17457.1 MAG: hypothetical protein [Helarchaeota virus Nidhogg Meg22_1214]
MLKLGDKVKIKFSLVGARKGVTIVADNNSPMIDAIVDALTSFRGNYPIPDTVQLVDNENNIIDDEWDKKTVGEITQNENSSFKILTPDLLGSVDEILMDALDEAIKKFKVVFTDSSCKNCRHVTSVSDVTGKIYHICKKDGLSAEGRCSFWQSKK